MNGILFIEKYYKNLYNSKEVKHSVRFHKNKTKYEDIRDYFNRLESISLKAINSGKKELLYNTFFSRYVIKKENINNRYTNEEKEKIIKSQKDSLRPWLDYLNTSCKEEYWIKYYIFQGMTSIGTYKESKDMFMKRSNKTISPFIEFDPYVIDKLTSYIKGYVYGTLHDKGLEDFIGSNSFNTLYYILLKEQKNNNSNITNGIWIKYSKSSKTDAYKLWNSIVYKNTFWCTRERDICIDQICGGGQYKAGDFYVYYTNDANDNPTVPRIAIKFDGDDIREIRGVLDSSQNLEPSLTGVVKRKLDSFKNLTDLDKEFYLKAIDDNRKITKINQKVAKGITLNKDELDFIFEIKEYIYSFGHGEDKRLHEIRSKNIIKDPDYLLKASKRIENILKYSSIELKNDKELVTTILRGRYYLIDQVGEKLKDNMDFMWPIIKKDPLFIRNAGNNIKKQRCVGLLVARYNLDSFRYMNISLLNDPVFIEDAKKIPGFEKKYLLTNNCDIIPKGDLNENK
jgi:hypothetical protein